MPSALGGRLCEDRRPCKLTPLRALPHRHPGDRRRPDRPESRPVAHVRCQGGMRPSLMGLQRAGLEAGACSRTLRNCAFRPAEPWDRARLVRRRRKAANRTVDPGSRCSPAISGVRTGKPRHRPLRLRKLPHKFWRSARTPQRLPWLVHIRRRHLRVAADQLGSLGALPGPAATPHPTRQPHGRGGLEPGSKERALKTVRKVAPRFVKLYADATGPRVRLPRRWPLAAGSWRIPSPKPPRPVPRRSAR